VAVRAQQAQVVEPVVVAMSVDVVQRHAQRAPAPLRDAAALAPVRLEPEGEQALLEVLSAPRRRQQLLQGHRLRPRGDVTALARGVERRSREAEPLLALGDRVSGVVVPLYLRPVVTAIAPIVDRGAQPAGVVRDGALG
jgi:hypothetical protein